MEDEIERSAKPDRLAFILRSVITILLSVILIGVIWVGFAYATTPQAIRHPISTHYHFRLQMIIGGKAEDFADTKYQTPENSDICTAALTSQPIHFHDKLDQFVHIHWSKMTGGILLKNYGWNFIGGTNGTLGYRFDKLPKLTTVPIHGRVLPSAPAGAKYYIYTGDSDGYKQRNWNDFLKQDFRDFFDGKTTSNNPFDGIIPSASAHDDEKLTELNDVLGSAVVFVQKDPPNEAQIKDRFAHLVPLPQSTCGG